ncbi:hypothetical protein Y032_0347g3162 [Ancylostoma ceylanicum]|uniref:guanylate cyclase n=1 Tax=Ancylostoma ceylanicum TaxID=53326 RepID=A0A016RXW8_9BILA|nr:hypothetical protein Y032_0347g3162 [Ancylostoma ceylanicum]
MIDCYPRKCFQDFLCLYCEICAGQVSKKTIKVGLLFVQNMTDLEVYVGYRTSASAVLIARDRIVKENLLPGFDFEFIYMFDQCNEELAAGYTIQQLSQGVDVILGPTCNYPTVAAAVISSFYNKPLFTWGLSTSSEFDNVARFPTMGLLSVNSYSLGVALRAVLLAFNWTQFAFVYSNLKDEQTCEVMKNDLQNAIAQHGNITLNYIGRITSMDTPGIKKVLDNVSKRARIVVTCFAEGYGYKRALLLTALDAGYLTSEYLYIMADPNSNGFYVPLAGGSTRAVWTDPNSPGDGRDEEAKDAFLKIFLVSSRDIDQHSSFTTVFTVLLALPHNCTFFRFVRRNSNNLFLGLLYNPLRAYLFTYFNTLSKIDARKC